MKKICLIILCVLLVCACSSNKEKEDSNKIVIEDTKYFHYSYSTGYYINASCMYTLDLEDNKYIASYKIAGVSEEDKLIKEIDKETVLKLESILTKYNIYKWNGFDKVDQDVLDGDDFSLHYKKVNGDEINASGYMMYPDGYKDFEKDIYSFYEELFKEELKQQKNYS